MIYPSMKFMCKQALTASRRFIVSLIDWWECHRANFVNNHRVQRHKARHHKAPHYTAQLKQTHIKTPRINPTFLLGNKIEGSIAAYFFLVLQLSRKINSLYSLVSQNYRRGYLANQNSLIGQEQCCHSNSRCSL